MFWLSKIFVYLTFGISSHLPTTLLETPSTVFSYDDLTLYITLITLQSSKGDYSKIMVVEHKTLLDQGVTYQK